MTRIVLLATLAVSACTMDEQDSDLPSPDGTLDTGRAQDPDGPGPLQSAPIAFCSVDSNPVSPPFETAILDGSASYSPDGIDIVGYEWSLAIAPDGNGAALSSRTDSATRLMPQLAGVYIVQLTVLDERGFRSEEPCEITLQATPASTLQVQMYWSHAGEDMDLHVVRPGGTARTPDDCYAGNCLHGLDWGEDASARMLASNSDGTGPEIVAVSTDEDGEFDVFVHDVPAVVREAPTDVTVDIAWNGERVFSETRSVTGEDTETHFATVNPSTGVVTPAP